MQVGKTEVVVQSTTERKVGEKVSLMIKPEEIHIMNKEFSSNKYDGYITKRNTVCFGDGEFECDVTQLYPGSFLDEEGYLITAEGERLDLTDVDVNVEVGLKDIEISDDQDAGGAIGNIVSMIYKGDHYHLTVRTADGDNIYVDTTDVWDDGDIVGIRIQADDIVIKKQAK